MAKKVVGSFKLQLPGGQATMAPPVGPAFGQRGLSGMEFVKQFNARTQKQAGQIIPAIITYYSDKTFTFELRQPPAAELIKAAAKISKGSAEANRVKVGKLTKKQVEEIAKIKMADMNCDTLEAAMKMIIGTARSLGVSVEE
ncbi:MAG: 50S ribosomal protein L11 [Bacteroidota bacterium]|nr:50S ribosomal protein L11 [Candidatus Kapabacteria bacterium]MDW8220898.1 50S ribosomal protein L11 [Bacteroidota bacterium]